RNTKNYLLLRKTTDFNQKYIFKLNSLDHVWINDIYDDGNDYSKSGFFNFIGKKDLDKGKYEIGLIVQNNDDIHYKMTNITVIV
ncbi:hypothetical protein ACTLIY_004250, partial [Cronobacter turicensis]